MAGNSSNYINPDYRKLGVAVVRNGQCVSQTINTGIENLKA